MEYVSEIIKTPYAGIVVLAIGILLSVFAGFSGNKKVNLSMTVITAISYIGCFYLYIRNFIIHGPWAYFLIDLGLPGIILTGIILFCGLNILLFLSLERLSQKSHIRTVILLSFSLISILFLIMSDNAVLVMTSLIVSILSIFSLLASLEAGSVHSSQYLGRFGMRAAVPAALALSGFSVLTGTGGIRNLSAYVNAENTGDPLLVIGVLTLACAVYLYFFFYPFQGIYLRLARRIGTSSAPVLWFLYLPTGVVILIKFDMFFSNYYGRENVYGFIILAVLGFLNLLGAGIGAIKAASTKRLISMFLLFQLGTVILIRAFGFIGVEPAFTSGIYDVAVLIIILVTFMPLFILTSALEKNNRDDSISGAGALIRKRPYIGICLSILLVWWLIADGYIFYFCGPVQGSGFLNQYFPGQGIEVTVLSLGYTATLILMAVNIVRIMIRFFTRHPSEDNPEGNDIPMMFYVYLSFFILLSITSVVLVIIGKAGIGQDHLNVWGNTFYIFGSGN